MLLERNAFDSIAFFSYSQCTSTKFETNYFYVLKLIMRF